MTINLNTYNHYWKYCEHCETNMVICGVCGNNSCNGGYGKVDGKSCTACPSAYKMQVEENKIECFNSQDSLIIDTGFK